MELKAMLDKWDAGELSFKPTCPREHRLLSFFAWKPFYFFRKLFLTVQKKLPQTKNYVLYYVSEKQNKH